jgi:hypothetical protein
MKNIIYYKINDSVVFNTSDGTIWWVPEDENNSDYQEYLAWLAEGNEPEVVES